MMDGDLQTELPDWTTKPEDDEEDVIPEKEDSDSEPDVDELLESQDPPAAHMGNAQSKYDQKALFAAIDAIPQQYINKVVKASKGPPQSAGASTSREASRDKPTFLTQESSFGLQESATANKPASSRESPRVDRPSSSSQGSSAAPNTSSSSKESLPTVPDGSDRAAGEQSISPVPPAKDDHLNQPPETPRPFPLSPPRPSQTLEIMTLPLPSPEPSTESDWEESMPTVEDMLSMTQPNYRSSKQNQSQEGADQSTNSVDEDPIDASPSKMPPRPTPVKRRITESPHIPISPRKKLKVEENVGKEPERVYIEILSSPDASENEEPQPPRTIKPHSQTKRPRSSQSKLTQKPKRKRTPSPVASASTSLPQQQPASSRRPPRKRARADPHRKHPVHWHLDGSILVQVDGIRFKLHRSILARHSDWFKHTFERGEDAPELAVEFIDNLPLYYLDGLGVDAHDFEVLLDALDEAITYLRIQPPFPTIASILRASTALTFTKQEEYATDCLEVIWSANLDDLTITPIPYAPESVALARRCALFPVLKRALYELVRQQRFGQQKRALGDPPSVRLDPQDLDALIDAREQLTNVWQAAADPDEFPPCAAEPAPAPPPPAANLPVPGGAPRPQQNAHPQPQDTACTATNRTLSSQAHANLVKATGIFRTFQYDPLCGLQALVDAPWEMEGFCGACVERRRDGWMRERERVWEELDGWFGL